MARLDRRWGAGSQQDSHEFLLALLERLQAECDRTPGKPKYRELPGEGSTGEQAAAAAAYAREWSNSWVDDCFGGLLQARPSPLAVPPLPPRRCRSSRADIYDRLTPLHDCTEHTCFERRFVQQHCMRSTQSLPHCVVACPPGRQGVA